MKGAFLLNEQRLIRVGWCFCIYTEAIPLLHNNTTGFGRDLPQNDELAIFYWVFNGHIVSVFFRWIHQTGLAPEAKTKTKHKKQTKKPVSDGDTGEDKTTGTHTKLGRKDLESLLSKFGHSWTKFCQCSCVFCRFNLVETHLFVALNQCGAS